MDKIFKEHDYTKCLKNAIDAFSDQNILSKSFYNVIENDVGLLAEEFDSINFYLQ
jgi:hypothetical protein